MTYWIWSNVSDQNSCSQQPPGSKSEKDLKQKREEQKILFWKQSKILVSYSKIYIWR